MLVNQLAVLLAGHKHKIINKAGTITAPVKKLKQGIENSTTSLTYSTVHMRVVSAVKLIFTPTI